MHQMMAKNERDYLIHFPIFYFRVILRRDHQPRLVCHWPVRGNAQYSPQVQICLFQSIYFANHIIRIDCLLFLFPPEFYRRGMRGRGVPPLVKKIVFGVLAKLLFIHLDVSEGCSCSTKAKV